MHDLVTLGEVLLRLAIPSPARFETARALDVQIGGAEANVAAACARLGLRTAWISALPDNPWGERVRRELVGHGIDCAYVRMLPGTRLGLYFLEYGVAPRPVHVLYDRRDSAFSRLTPEAVDWAPIQRARLVHVSGITPALGVHARMLVARIFDQVAVVSFDINYPSALCSPAEARALGESVPPRAGDDVCGRREDRGEEQRSESTQQLRGRGSNYLKNEFGRIERCVAQQDVVERMDDQCVAKEPHPNAGLFSEMPA